MKKAIFLYNPQSGKGRTDRKVEDICEVFSSYGYDIEPLQIDFDANPFDGHEQVELVVVTARLTSPSTP